MVGLLILLWAQTADFTYRETDLIPGAAMVDRLKQVSQRDLLEETKADEVRGGPAAMLDAYLLLGGDWASVAGRLKVGDAFTFENVHRAQEALYDLANQDGKPGVIVAYQPDWDDNDGKLRGWDLRPTDEAHRVFDFLGLEFAPLYGPFKERLAQKRASVEAALAESAPVVLIVEDVAAARSAVVYRREGVYFMLDPSVKVGQFALRRMSDEEVRAMVFETINPVISVRLKR